jgi:hypothetical protein
MKRILAMALFFGIMSTFSAISAQEVVAEAPEVTEASGWKKAGGEISEAAHAVGDATADTSKKAWKATKDGSAEVWGATKKGSREAWGATKEGSAKAWKSTKEKSKNTWQKGKKKFHDATAPDPVIPEGD